MSVNTKEFEIVVFGATSFVGKILCNYLCNEYREPNLRWAMAARSSAKLAELKADANLESCDAFSDEVRLLFCRMPKPLLIQEAYADFPAI